MTHNRNAASTPKDEFTKIFQFIESLPKDLSLQEKISKCLENVPDENHEIRIFVYGQLITKWLMPQNITTDNYIIQEFMRHLNALNSYSPELIEELLSKYYFFSIIIKSEGSNGWKENFLRKLIDLTMSAGSVDQYTVQCYSLLGNVISRQKNDLRFEEALKIYLDGYRIAVENNISTTSISVILFDREQHFKRYNRPCIRIFPFPVATLNDVKNAFKDFYHDVSPQVIDPNYSSLDIQFIKLTLDYMAKTYIEKPEITDTDDATTRLWKKFFHDDHHKHLFTKLYNEWKSLDNVKPDIIQTMQPQINEQRKKIDALIKLVGEQNEKIASLTKQIERQNINNIQQVKEEKNERMKSPTLFK